ncbi:MAG: ATP synthase F1 subunit delta [Fidelibacterota bacterium]
MLRKKSKRYAGALFSLARDRHVEDRIYESLQVVSDLYDRDPFFRAFFYTTKAEPGEKVRILSQALGDRVQRVVLEFLGLLAEKREHKLLRPTISSFDALYRSRIDVVSVTTITSVPLGKAEVDEIHRRLETALAKRVDMATSVDPDLIGGVRLRIGNTVLDGSVETRLEKMKQSLL